MLQNRSSFINPRGMLVTDVLPCKGPFRMRAVRSIFRERESLTVCWTPVHSGSGILTTSHNSFKIFFTRRILIYCCVLMSVEPATKLSQRREAQKDPENRRSHFTPTLRALWRCPKSQEPGQNVAPAAGPPVAPSARGTKLQHPPRRRLPQRRGSRRSSR
jgi:hypothetical protein